MFDPREGLRSAGEHAHRVRRAAGRLLFSGIGFSAAYFLDPDLGPARRKAAAEAFWRTRRAIASARAGDEVVASGGAPASSEAPDRVGAHRAGTHIASDGVQTPR